jgi:hypothetical protein
MEGVKIRHRGGKPTQYAESEAEGIALARQEYGDRLAADDAWETLNYDAERLILWLDDQPVVELIRLTR